jgi:hypothetical protein
MQLDVRIPMGVMFAILGAILLVYGVLTGPGHPIYARSLGYNVNLWWGLFLLLFGGAMLALARRAARRPSSHDQVPSGSP